MVAPQHANIFPELATVAIIDAERAIDTVLSHAGSQPADTGSAELAFNDVSNPLGAAHGGGEQLAELGSLIPEVYAAYGAWIEASGNFADISAGNGAPGYHAQTGGFLAGLSRNITPNVSLGLAVGYAYFSLSENDTQASGTDNNGRVALYGAYNLGSITVSALGGFGYDAFSTTRPLIVGTAKENHDGLEANFGLQISQNLDLGQFQLIPLAGFDYANLQENGFSETGAGGADLDGQAHGTSSLQPFLGVAAGRSFELGSWSITPSAHVTWRYEALNRQRSLLVAAQDGTLFNINGVTTAQDQLDTGAAISAQAGPNLQIYGAYDALVGFGFGLDQSVSAGLKYNF